MKYICTERLDGREEIFIFPDDIDHDAMAEALGRIKDQTHSNWKRVFRKPVSAGFVDSKGTCFGQSVTLGLDSRRKDSELLAEQ